MKSGYKILIHKSLKDKDYKEAITYCDSFIEMANDTGYGNGGWKSYYRRGTFGMHLTHVGLHGYTFKRISKKRRIFGVVPIDDLTNVNLNQCMCPIHLGGSKVNFKDTFNESNYYTYYEIGDIKG